MDGKPKPSKQQQPAAKSKKDPEPPGVITYIPDHLRKISPLAQQQQQKVTPNQPPKKSPFSHSAPASQTNSKQPTTSHFHYVPQYKRKVYVIILNKCIYHINIKWWR